MKSKVQLILTALLISAGLLHAQIAADSADNYASWTNGSNGGSGFLAWSFSSNDNGITNFAGSFLGDSTAGAGNINTAGVSFGLYANPGGSYMNADRGFASSLAVGQTFSLNLALNYDNGNKGINLFAGTQGEVFNFNVGNGGSVSSNNDALLIPGSGSGYDYGGNDAVLNLSFQMQNATTFAYEISRSSSQGFQGVLFSGTVTGLTDAPSGFRLYNSWTDSGEAQNNLYSNNLQIIPEPASVLMLLGGVGLLLFLKRRRG